ncbi:cell division protein ZipA [Alkalilimnicola ehrlichii]|uniref:Cell division protein ZipA n=1 Tax=Alkalilimnicola ehrlichii TaxID=351052 RepID=A0A3E0WYE7_9GAMM|nr:cell division protein ZipA [Alkalilimnicola ehrlichii]RFA27739.1 cell division protein ZipA [Alkalilimnicola ehrlichii]RFA36927.1 cell division protein ZipA [Alkalilimnicola ehrlichii]
MDELRWFLLIVGLLVIGGIYGFGRWQEHRRQGGRGPGKSRREAFSDDGEVDAALRDLDAVIGAADPVDPVSRPLPVEPDEPAKPVATVESPVPKEPVREKRSEPTAAPMPEGLEQKFIVIHVASPNGEMYRGDELWAAMEAVGLEHGEYDIFHHYIDLNGKPCSMFSVANMLEPGWFDRELIDEIRSPGLALFLQLPAPFEGQEAFDEMLATARALAEHLNATLLDGRRCNLTQQAIEHIREELREYRRRAHLLASQQKR